MTSLLLDLDQDHVASTKGIILLLLTALCVATVLVVLAKLCPLVKLPSREYFNHVKNQLHIT